MDHISDEDRLNNLIEVISGMAGLDFTQEAIVDDSDHPLNTVAAGLNMLSEELESSVVSKSELEYKNQELERLTREQQDTMSQMSTPIAQLWDGILLLPLVGTVSSKRAQEILQAVLEKISETQATVFILDISGIAVVDTAVANHFIKIAKATKLMGCQSVISGVSGAVAQTIVELGIQIDEITTTGTMQDALEYGFHQTGAKLVRNK